MMLDGLQEMQLYVEVFIFIFYFTVFLYFVVNNTARKA